MVGGFKKPKRKVTLLDEIKNQNKKDDKNDDSEQEDSDDSEELDMKI